MKKRILLIALVLLCNLSFMHLQAQESSKLTSRKVSKTLTTEHENENYKNFRFTLGGGYSRWLGSNLSGGSKELKDFNSSLRNGFNIDLEAQYYTHEYMGFGLNGTFVQYSNDKTKEFGIEETDKIFFLGATWNARHVSNKWGFYSGLGLGPLFYSGKGTIMGESAKFNKTVLGINANLVAEYRLTESIGAGLKFSVTAGSFKLEGMDDRMSVSSLMLGGFLSFKTK